MKTRIYYTLLVLAAIYGATACRKEPVQTGSGAGDFPPDPVYSLHGWTVVRGTENTLAGKGVLRVINNRLFLVTPFGYQVFDTAGTRVGGATFPGAKAQDFAGMYGPVVLVNDTVAIVTSITMVAVHSLREPARSARLMASELGANVRWTYYQTHSPQGIFTANSVFYTLATKVDTSTALIGAQVVHRGDSFGFSPVVVPPSLNKSFHDLPAVSNSQHAYWEGTTYFDASGAPQTLNADLRYALADQTSTGGSYILVANKDLKLTVLQKSAGGALSVVRIGPRWSGYPGEAHYVDENAVFFSYGRELYGWNLQTDKYYYVKADLSNSYTSIVRFGSKLYVAGRDALFWKDYRSVLDSMQG